jgi:ornithine cyclodeaminase/alanine dehydrogenase-like protein (mu-crystallin family)
MVLILRRGQIQSLITMQDAIKAVENALIEIGEKMVVQPHRPYLQISSTAGFLLNSGYLKRLGGVGVKIASSYAGNFERGLPTVSSLIVLFDPDTGLPLSIMEGGYLTALKTGAVGGVAVKYLSRDDAENLTLIGAGEQAKFQLFAIQLVRPIKKVKVLSRRKEIAARFAYEMSRRFGIDIEVAENSKCALKDSDIIVAATTSTTPVIVGEEVSEGVHISGIGSFTPEAAEIDARSFARSGRVYVDNLEAINVGDIKFAIEMGAISLGEVYHLADVMSGRVVGRKGRSDITIFKSVGGAAYDVAVALQTYRKARETGVGIEFDLLS